MTKTAESATSQPQLDQPGLGELREAVVNYAELPSRAALRSDGIAGLTVAISNVPDGMAGGLLAGVNPLYGLYANAVGPMVGGLLSSTRLMVINNTSAVSLVAGQALLNLPTDGRDEALFLMVMLTGVFAILLGLLRLGRLTQFVSYSVMTGFLAGIAVVLILSQLSTIAGYEAVGANRITQTFDLLGNLDQVHVPSLALAALTLLLSVFLRRTRLLTVASLLAIAVPSLLAPLLDMEGVQVVQDLGEIPGGLPTPFLPTSLPPLPVMVEVLTGALAVAAVVLVQGAGVSQSVPNPDGSRKSMSRDFIAQGVANVVVGLLRGLPVGGSLSGTMLNVVSRARTRWAGILGGLWTAVIVVGFPGLVSLVAMPALGALLILAGLNSIKPREIASIWDAGWASRLVSLSTFVSTLLLPIQAAVGIGVVFSALLYLNQSSADIRVVQLVKRPDGRIEECRPPSELPADQVTVLNVYGHLFYAGARTLQRLLPRPQDSQNPVVVLRLRGQNAIGATLTDVLASYAERLRAVNGRLYLSGLSDQAYDRLANQGKLRLTGPVRAYEATPVIGESTDEAVAEARAWLVRQKAQSEAPERGQ
jgi:SulP family sulfate permease